MKTPVKYLAMGIVVAMLGFSTSSCKKENQDGYMSVKMTDAPANYTAVNVEITGVEVNNESAGWISLPVHAGVYNLLSLQNDVSVVIADPARLPLGKINQLRLILGTHNTVSDSVTTFPLTIPSGSETGLKINIDQVITSNHTVQVLLDFDAGASVVTEGNGSYALKPVLRVKSVIQN